MNTIKIVNNKIVTDIDDTINVELIEKTNFFSVKKIIINIQKDTNLRIDFKNKSLEKWNIEFNVNGNFNLFMLSFGSESKIQYVYNLNDFSNTFVYKFNDVKTIKERTIINLNGINSKINYNFRTISKNIEEYDYLINHNASNTESVLNTNGVNIRKGILSFNITGEVKNNIKDSIINESSRIINLTNNECIIKPNLLIEEYSVSANHSALIGNFNDDELFYLQSRGIPKKKAINLLIKGFLLENSFEEYKLDIEKIIDKYWR